jgi:D-amino-acid dehydrogenase
LTGAPDVIVVGAGAVGLASALELAQAGARVTVVEVSPELALGCSAGNAGLVCPGHAAPLASRASLRVGLRSAASRDGPVALAPRPSLAPWLLRFAASTGPEREQAAGETLRRLAVASLELHRRYAERHGTGLEPRGTLNVFETDDGLAAGLHDARGHASAGLVSEALTAREAMELEPALAPGLAGAIFYPGELSGDPAVFVRALGAAVAAMGVELRLRTEVLSVRSHGSRVTGVETSSGPLDGETIVLAAGAWTPRLARSLGVRVPVQGGKGYHLDYEPADVDPRIPVYVHEARVVATGLPGRLRLTGVLALSGLDLSVDERRLAAIERVGARRLVRFAGRRRLEIWRGLRPCSPDGLPIVGRTRASRGLVLATGHAMLGFTLAPVTGRLVAQIVSRLPTDHPTHALSPDRFGRLPPLPRRRGQAASRRGSGETSGISPR